MYAISYYLFFDDMRFYTIFFSAPTGRLEGNASDAQHACVGSVWRFRVRARQTGDGRRRKADG